jgi:hypothetical protein
MLAETRSNVETNIFSAISFGIAANPGDHQTRPWRRRKAMGLGETLVAGVAGELLRRGRAPHLVAADATTGFVPGDLGRRA